MNRPCSVVISRRQFDRVKAYLRTVAKTEAIRQIRGFREKTGARVLISDAIPVEKQSSDIIATEIQQMLDNAR